MELIYQEEKEVKPVYDMYQKIFEDPEEFAKYYFEEVYASNEVLLAREGQKILGMIHLNPYHIRTGEKTYTLNYIVAVAVWKEYRRQGIMAAMLTKCLNDMHQKRQPFTYLMPANKAYYEPFQFTFVMDWEETMIHSMNDSDKIIPAIQQDARIVTAPEEEYDRITIFLEQFMQPYQIYTIPDKQYLRRLSKESQSGEGNLMVYYEGEQLTGVFAESFEDDEVYIRWAYSTQPENMLNEIKYRYKNKKIYITEGNLTKGEKYQRLWQGSQISQRGERSFMERVILHSGFWSKIRISRIRMVYTNSNA